MIMIGTSASIALIVRSTSTPVAPSILRSVITKSARLALNASIPAAPLAAITGSWPSFLTVWARPSRMVSLSSMMRITAIGVLVSRSRARHDHHPVEARRRAEHHEAARAGIVGEGERPVDLRHGGPALGATAVVVAVAGLGEDVGRAGHHLVVGGRVVREVAGVG